ncbi:MAG: hypothetical protein AAF415_14210 [Pseudomonadota bacterium]
MLVGLLAASQTRLARVAVTEAVAQEAVASARWTARAGLEVAMHRLNRSDANSVSCQIGDARMQISIEDEEAKIDLNMVSPPTIRALLTRLGLPEAASTPLADAIADYRDADDLVRLNGAEGTAYDALGLPGPKNAPLESFAELTRVLGAENLSLAQLSRHATVHSGRRSVDPALASPIVLGVLQDLSSPKGARAPSRRAVFRILVTVETMSGARAGLGAVVRIGRSRTTVLDLWDARIAAASPAAVGDLPDCLLIHWVSSDEQDRPRRSRLR